MNEDDSLKRTIYQDVVQFLPTFDVTRVNNLGGKIVSQRVTTCQHKKKLIPFCLFFSDKLFHVTCYLLKASRDKHTRFQELRREKFLTHFLRFLFCRLSASDLLPGSRIKT